MPDEFDRFDLLPLSIKENYRREEMESVIDRHLEQASALAKALSDMDDGRLSLVFFSDRADPERGIVPGRWHVRRRNDLPSPNSYMPITTPDGDYKEPGFFVIEELRKRDLRKHGLPTYTEPANDLQREQVKDEARLTAAAALRVAGDGGMTRRRFGAS